MSKYVTYILKTTLNTIIYNYIAQNIKIYLLCKELYIQ